MNIAEIRKRSVPLCLAHKRFNKVFGIGANKTGTTTLKAIFQILGLRVAPEQEGALLGVPFLKGHHQGLVDYIHRHDAFQDHPFSLKTTYAQVDALFPGSRFILTHREPGAWFRSVTGYARKSLGLADGVPVTRDLIRRKPYLYPGYREFIHEATFLADVDDALALRRDWALLHDEAHFIRQYVERNKSIVRHFSDRPGDLLVIDLTRERSTSRIVEFLGLPAELATEVPHLNRT